jgi:hypothetical protein
LNCRQQVGVGRDKKKRVSKVFISGYQKINRYININTFFMKFAA